MRSVCAPQGGLCTESVLPLAEALEAVLACCASSSSGATELAYCRAPFAPELLRDCELRQLAAMCRGGGTAGGAEAEAGAHGTDPPFVLRNCGVWVSAPGCETPLHYDLCHGLLAQVVGHKRALLAEPRALRQLYPNPEGHANPMASRVDLPRWLQGDPQQRQAFPRVATVDFQEAVLNPGDVLYIPPFW